MKTEFWVKIAAKKAKYGLPEWLPMGHEIRKSKPSTGPNEVAVKMTVEIPDAYFETPELSAKICVPESAVKSPIISADVQSNIAAILSEQLGMTVHVSAGEKDDAQG